MGMPKVPENTPPTIDVCNAVAWVVTSVAYEELALAHIINAEGEKIQKVIWDCTVKVADGQEMQDILTVNESVKEMLQTIICKESVLFVKLAQALDFLDEHCPPPPPAPTYP